MPRVVLSQLADVANGTEVVASIPADSADGVRPPVRLGRGLLVLCDQGIASATSLVTGALLGHTLPKAEFGAFILGMTVVAWATNIQAALITTPYLYRHRLLPTVRQSDYAGNLLIQQLLYGCVCAAAVAAIALSPLFDVHGIGVATAYVLAAALLPLLLKEFARQFSLATLRPADALAIDLAVFAIQGGSILWATRHGFLVGGIGFAAMGLAALAPAFAWVYGQRAQFSIGRSRLIKDFNDNWSIARWLVIGYAVNSVGKDLYGWVLGFTHGLSTAGIFGACTSTALLIGPLTIGVGNHLGPTFAETLSTGGSSRLHALIRRTTWKCMQAAAAYACCILVFGDRIMFLIYGVQYRGNLLTLTLLSAGAGLAFTTVPVGIGLYALGRADLNVRAALAGVASTVVLGVLLAVNFGAPGAALGVFLANLAESTTKILIYLRLRTHEALAHEGDAR